MKIKRKGKNTNTARQILDNDEYLDTSTAYSSNNNNQILSTVSNNNSLSSSNNNNRLLSTFNNNTSSPSSNDKNPAPSPLSINTNPAPLSINTSSASSLINISPVPLLINNNPAAPSNNNYSIGRKSSSNVWQYAIKSGDGKTAICQLCIYTCALVSHSTSTIRYHLIHQHNKQDLIINSSSSSSSSTKPHISEQFKREVHNLCYKAIVIDHRPFNDLRKQGILAIFNKLCPGIIDF